MTGFRGIIAAVLAGMPLAIGAQNPVASSDSLWVHVAVEQTATPTLALTASPGSYVVVVRVSNDLRAHVIFPVSPSAQRPFPEGPGSFQIRLDVPKYSAGGIYAAASSVPFNFAKIAKGGGWDEDAMILGSSQDPEHAANRVFGLITPAAASVATAETFYTGARTARGNISPALLASRYLPSRFGQDAGIGACWLYSLSRSCGTFSPSPYLGCLSIGPQRRFVCGSVSDMFFEMRRQLPPREVISAAH